jgi:fatty-acyl-CoA synthase
MYVRDWMARRARLSPDNVAVIEYATGSRITYRELNERANRLANFLRDRCGIRSGDRLAVLAMNRVEILEALFAAAKLTAILVPLNYRLTAPELQYIIDDCEPKVLLYEKHFRQVVDEMQKETSVNCCVSLDNPDSAGGCQYAQSLAASSVEDVRVESFDAEMALLIIYTSGTTGRPKGALLSHRMLHWNSVNTLLGWDLSSADITPVHMPMFHTGGLNVLATPLLHVGGTLVLLRKFDPADALEAIERYRCTLFFAVPTMFQMMTESPGFETTDFTSMRFFISGGAPCPIPLIEAFQRRGVVFTQGYGLTEVGPNCFKLGTSDAVAKAGSIGFPSFHSEARIVDLEGREVSRGEAGELVLKGLHVCTGYWRNTEATGASLRDGWFYTGDLARQDSEGYYYIAGRAKDMIISGGENIYPAEVEAVLDAHCAVASAAVFGLADARWGETPAAAVILRAGQEATADDLIEFCAGKLARYKIPKRVFFVNEFPLSGSGKVVKRILKATIEQQLV